jgi:hypothetical protein
VTLCAIGGRLIVGPTRRVITSQHPGGVDTCEAHGLAYEFGDRLADSLAALLGDDHPYVDSAHRSLDGLLAEPCPEPLPVAAVESAAENDLGWLEVPPPPTWATTAFPAGIE